MFLSDIMEKMGIPFEVIDEKPVKSLGLVNYNNGDAVCTFAENISFLESVPKGVSMLITKVEVAEVLKKETRNYGFIITEHPRVAFFLLHNFLTRTEEYRRGLSPTVIGENCNISKMSCVAENNVVIGNNVTIEELFG